MARQTALMAVLVMAACGGGGDAPSPGEGGAVEPAEWRIGEPILDVGVAEGDPGRQLHRVGSVRRTTEGGLVVLDASDPHARHFAPDGALRSWFASDGGGPGELNGSGGTAVLRGDTLHVFSGWRGGQLDRYLLDGTYLGGEQLEASPLKPFAVQAHVVVPNGVTAFNEAAATALAERSLPDPDRVLAYVRPSADGLLWVGRFFGGGDAESWEVVDARGVTVARVQVPPRFTVYDSGDGWVAGVLLDSLDVEHAQLRTVEGTLPEGSERMVAGGPGIPASAVPRDEKAVATMQGFLRQLVAFQELHYADPANRFTYAASLADLPVELPDGFTATIPTAGDRGWAGVIRHEATGVSCAMAVDNVRMPGVEPGVVTCYGQDRGNDRPGSRR